MVLSDGKDLEDQEDDTAVVVRRQLNATEIADRLGVSQATISQHIAELKGMGAIEEVDNEHIRKWKYYRTNPGFDADSFIKGENRMGNVGRIAVGVAVVVVIGLVVLGLTYGHAAQTKGNLILSLTDPPQVPAGTSALVVAYSSVQAHVIGNGTGGIASASGWINATGSGTLDLMQLINASQVIGSATVPNGSSVNMLRFGISNAKITINGTTYNVTVPSSEITAKVSTTVINGTSQAIIDLTPTVIAIYGQNTTTFVMVPAVRAIVIPSNHHASVTVGSKTSLDAATRAELEHAKPQISIASTSLAVSGVSNSSSTSFSVTLHNGANVPITINHVMLFGNMSVRVSPILPFSSDHGESNSAAHANASANVTVHNRAQVPEVATKLSATVEGSANATMNRSENPGIMVNGTLTSGEGDNGSIKPIFVVNTTGNASVSASGNASSGGDSIDSHNGSGSDAKDAIRLGMSHNVGIDVNGTALMNGGVEDLLNATLNASARARLNSSFNATLTDIVDQGVLARAMHTLNFEVSPSGSLVLPQDAQMFENGGVGYTMAPNATVTFSFNGSVVLANGHLGISPIAGDAYRVFVQGKKDASAYANVTAS